MKKSDAVKELSKIASTWPRPGEFIFYMEDDHMWLHKIRLPSSERGAGTKRMAQILSITDKANIGVSLCADPVPQDDDDFSLTNPDTFHLVRWYNRFGFVSYGPTEDGFFMDRPAKNGSSVDGILLAYKLNKRNDITVSDFEKKWFSNPDALPASYKK